jgi:hypothetical protein
MCHTDCVCAEKVAKEVIWLPHYVLLGDEADLEETTEIIKALQARFCC